MVNLNGPDLIVPYAPALKILPGLDLLSTRTTCNHGKSAPIKEVAIAKPALVSASLVMMVLHVKGRYAQTTATNEELAGRKSTLQQKQDACTRFRGTQ